MKRHNREAFTLIETIVVMAIIGLLLGMTMAAVQRVRMRVAALDCQNRLRQVSIALQSYHGAHLSFPPGCRGFQSPQPHMSWMTRILPFLDDGALWEESLKAFRAAPFFLDKPHLQIVSRAMPKFMCPLEQSQTADFSVTVGLTSFLGVSGRSNSVFDGVIYFESAVRIADITDGTSCTLAVGERPPSRDKRLGWWYAGWGSGQDGTGDLILGVRERNSEYPHCPRQSNHFVPGTDSDCDAFHFWSRHPGGAHFVLADGSVRFLAYSTNLIMPALATRAGGEAVSVPD